MEPVINLQPRETGWIEVITGCMFSGKTEELIRRLKRAKIAKQVVIVFKPKIDNRFSENEIVSHSEFSHTSINVETPEEIYEKSIGAQVIGIDEAQFFSKEIISICNKLADNGKRVIKIKLCFAEFIPTCNAPLFPCIIFFEALIILKLFFPSIIFFALEKVLSVEESSTKIISNNSDG